MDLAEEIATVHQVRLTEQDEADIDEALGTARYLAAEDLLLVELRSGQRVAVPVEDLQGLADADRALVAQVELDGIPGWPLALHWEALDVDFSVVGLAEGRTGSERWMANLPQRRRERLNAS